MTQLSELVPNTIWTAHRPQKFLRMRIGTRMTVVRLPSGGLLLHSPIALSPELQAELDALGPVVQIIAPNRYHHLYAGDCKTTYPDALLHAAPGLQKKLKKVIIDAELGEEPHPAFEGSLEPVFVAGCMLRETVFFHPASKTLISSDLVENFVNGSPHLPTRLYLKTGGIHGKPGLHPLLKFTYRNKKAARHSIDRILDWDFERIVLAHGDTLITEDAKDILAATYHWLK